MSKKVMQPFLYGNYEAYVSDRVVHVMTFPIEWQEVIAQEKRDYWLPVKFQYLAQHLHSIFPDILLVKNNWNKLTDQQPWIISWYPIPEKAILLIALNFMNHSHSLKNKEAIQQDVSLSWEERKLEDIIAANDDFMIYPGMIAHEFCASPREIPGVATSISFYYVKSREGFEVVSEPITSLGSKEKFSYVIHFDLITRGIENKKLLKVTPASRRYYQSEDQEPAKKLRYGLNHSIYIDQNQMFFQNESNSLGKYSFSKRNGKLQWGNNIGKIISELYTDLPELEEIMQSSPDHLTKQNKRIMLGYTDNGYYSGTNLKVGISVRERNSLIELMEKVFPRLLKVDTHESIVIPNRKKLTEKDFLNARADKRIDLYCYTSDELLNEALRIWEEKKYIYQEEGEWFIDSEPKTRIKVIPMGNEMVTELPRREDRRIDMMKFEAGWKGNLPSADSSHLALSLVEIEAYHEQIGGKEKDSKAYIRNMLRKKGSISQFIHPLDYDKNFKERIQKALRDLLTDAGFLHKDFLQTRFNENPILSFRLVGKGKGAYLPVLSKFANGQLVYKTPHSNEWITNDEFLTTNYSDGLSYYKQQKKVVYQWLESQLIGELNQLHESVAVYLIVDATLRNWFEELTNPNLKGNQMPFQKMNIYNKERIKVIRINNNKDVPPYYIWDRGDNNNLSSGLFKNKIGIYYDVGVKPDTHKINKLDSRIKGVNKSLRKQQAMEVIPLNYADEKEQDNMAIMIRYLRRMSLNYSDPLKAPITMHAINALKKYLSGEEYRASPDDLDTDIYLE